MVIVWILFLQYQMLLSIVADIVFSIWSVTFYKNLIFIWFIKYSTQIKYILSLKVILESFFMHPKPEALVYVVCWIPFPNIFLIAKLWCFLRLERAGLGDE